MPHGMALYSMTNYTSADGGSHCTASREAESTLLNLELRPSTRAQGRKPRDVNTSAPDVRKE